MTNLHNPYIERRKVQQAQNEAARLRGEAAMRRARIPFESSGNKGVVLVKIGPTVTVVIPKSMHWKYNGVSSFGLRSLKVHVRVLKERHGF